MQHAIGFVFLLACLTALADPAEDVRCREIGFSLAAEHHDWERFAAFIDEDARFVSESVLRGRVAVVEAWSSHFAAGGPAIRWRPRFVEVLEDGQWALTRGPFRVVTMDEAGNASETWGTFNSVWRLHSDGQWRVVFDAGSAAAQGPDAAVRALLEQDTGCQGHEPRG